MKRSVAGLVLSIALMGVSVAALLPFRDHIGSATSGMVLIVPVLIGVVVGGGWVAPFIVASGFFCYVLFFIKPYDTLYIGPAQNWVPLGVYVVVTLLVARVVAALNASRREARQKTTSLETESQLLQNAHALARLGTFRIDREAQTIELSAELSELYGLPREAHLLPLEEYRSRFYYPDDLASNVSQAETAYQSATTAHIESRVVRADGQRIWVRSLSRVERHPDGSSYVQGVVQDVTDLALARLDLEAKADEFKRLAENATDIVFQSDLERNLVWISPSIEHFTGISPSELIGTPAFNLIAEADWPVLETFRDVALEQGNPVELRVRMKHLNGAERWVAIAARSVRDESDEVVGIIGGVRDCHEEVTLGRAVQTLSGGSMALARATNESELLNDTCNVAVKQGGYLAAWFGRRVDNSTQDIETVAASDGALEYLKQLNFSWSETSQESSPTARALRSGETQVTADLVREIDRADWRELAMNLGLRSSASLPVRVDGQVDGVLVVYASETDAFDDRAVATLEYLALEIGFGIGRLREQVRLDAATEQRDRNAHQLEQMARLESIGQLAGGIAHDFNNLLTVQMSYSTLISRELDKLTDVEPEAIERLRSDVSKITMAAEQAAELTQRLLSFARAKKAEMRSSDLNDVVQDTEALLRRVVPTSISVRASLAPDLPNVNIDAGQIGQVIMNLVANATDAMNGVGAIDIVTDLVNEDGENPQAVQVRLRVIDDGPGMTGEVRDRAFEPFFTTKAPGKGTGLGLATVYGIVTQAGGTIAIESEVGAGTTFDIRFSPAREEVTAERVDPVQRVPSKTVGSVLIVDDEEDIREAAAVILRTAGYEVACCANGPAALSLLSDSGTEVDLLFSDLQMPDMVGTELARLAVEQRPRLKVLFTSGYGDQELDVENPDVWFLQKPYSSSQLLSAVQKVLNS